MRRVLAPALLMLLAVGAAAESGAGDPAMPDKDAIVEELEALSGSSDALGRLQDDVSSPAAQYLLYAGTQDFDRQDAVLRGLLGEDSDAYKTWRSLFAQPGFSSSRQGLPVAAIDAPTPHPPSGRAALSKAQGIASSLGGGANGGGDDDADDDADGLSNTTSAGLVCGAGSRPDCGAFAQAKVDYNGKRWSGELDSIAGRGYTRNDAYVSLAPPQVPFNPSLQAVAGTENNSHTGFNDRYAGVGAGLDIGDKTKGLGELQPGVYATAESDDWASPGSKPSRTLYATLNADADWDRAWKSADVHESAELITSAAQISAKDVYKEFETEVGFQLPGQMAVRLADDHVDNPDPPADYPENVDVLRAGVQVPAAELAVRAGQAVRGWFVSQNQR